MSEAGAAESEKSAAEQRVGTVIADRYRLHNLLAMGGMGAVYTGEHVHMRKRVAIKLLHKDMQDHAALMARFEREAIVGAHVEHPNVAAARDFGHLPDGACYLVLEFVRGLTLRQLINQGPLSVPRAIRIARQLAAALAAVHARGIVHRDIAPRNVMVVPGSEDQVKLIDFGFAKVPVEKFTAMSIQGGTPIIPSEITPTGIIFGTIGYLAPEGVFGMDSVTAKSDLYALGAILYELLAGVAPFEATSQAGLFLKHRTEPVPRISERAPGVAVPLDVEAIARKLLEKKPPDRFESADDVVRALDAAAVNLAPESTRPENGAGELPLTVLGVQAPVSLPRFEDVADVELVDPEAADEKPAGAATVRPQATQGTSAGKWLALIVAVGALVVAGVLFAPRFIGAPQSELSPAASSAAASPAPPSQTAVAAAPTQSNSAPATASVARPTQVDGLDAAAWKAAVRRAPSTNDYERALAGLLALAELDEKALDAEDMRANAVDTAVRFSVDKERGPKLFDALANRFGQGGIDVLFEIVSKRGGSRGATLAGELLAKPEIRARGSKALAIALELREATCTGKLALVERAKNEADGRGLAILVATRGDDCESTGCCTRDNAAVDAAIREIAKRSSPAP